LHSKITEIVKKLNTQFLNKSQNLDEISIFLCGGSSKEEEKFRRKVGEKICATSKHSPYKYSVYYPEDMFIELILGYQKQDLLTLENLLADSASSIVILLQSPGTFTELGAFTNFKKLSNKLIVIIDPKYTRKKSFINLGPVRFLKTKTKSKVLFIPMNNSNLNKLVEQITEVTRDMDKHSLQTRDLTNPIFAYRFYLALIYIFEPIPKNAVLTISRSLATNKEKKIATVAEIVINSLINERRVSLSSKNLSTTSKGSDDLIYGSNTKKRAYLVLEFLTELRLEALNLIHRKNYRRIWGEAEGS
jgi:hypothetical protein